MDDAKVYIYLTTCFCFWIYYDNTMGEHRDIFIWPIVIFILPKWKWLDIFWYTFGIDNQSISEHS